ncbi:hypothetical protein [Streptomyces katsurahamanus]|uniref:Phage holin family protein n=1 Tax=Streptomyces katsurahamanus TaxID=2577098 RepID=A0ABW9P2R3_9ACTN|nr:hypothetical protein [Streptomyces katsurahamanus]MQS39649.1 hypothetical protein [Streptomyces katsurahamanus]
MTDLRRNTLQRLPWILIAALGAFGLVRPVLSIVGAYDSGPLEKPVGPLVFTALIAVVWVGAAVVLRTPQPVPALLFAGVAYGAFAIILNLSLQPFLDDADAVPVIGSIGILVFNAVQGAVLGLIALGLQRVLHRTGE